MFEVSELGAGEHVLKIVHQADGFTLDAIEAEGVVVPPPPVVLERFEEDDAAFRYSAGWTTYTSGSYSDGSARSTWTAGASVEVTFTGGDLRIIGLKGPGRGTAEVFVDGVSVGMLDAEQPLWQFQAVMFEVSELGAGEHVLEIVHQADGFTLDAIEAEGVVE
jgi:hypothetical protein